MSTRFPPIWSIIDGWVQPGPLVDIPPLAQTIQQRIAAENQSDVPIFLRGSLVEKYNPHPKADIDLIVVTDQKNPPVSFQRLSDLGKVIDPQPLSWDFDCPVLATLLWTRSLQVSGRTIPQQAVFIDSEWILAHWLVHGMNRLPPTIRSQGLRRVSHAKQLIRCAGLIWYMKEGQFSRDLPICIQWAREIDAGLGNELHRLFETLGPTDQPPFEIGRIQDKLQRYFYAHWNDFDPSPS